VNKKNAPRIKHVPMRTCLGTRQKFPKRDLVRLVLTDEGRILVDETGKRSGSRGAYLSKSRAAAEAAVQQKRLEAVFERALDPADAEALLVYFDRFD
jgi:hypothetical protein